MIRYEYTKGKEAKQKMEKYKFEMGDLRAFITVINVMLIIKFGLSVAWVGLTIAALGLAIDVCKYTKHDDSFRINSVIIHLANVILNVFFMTMKGV